VNLLCKVYNLAYVAPDSQRQSGNSSKPPNHFFVYFALCSGHFKEKYYCTMIMRSAMKPALIFPIARLSTIFRSMTDRQSSIISRSYYTLYNVPYKDLLTTGERESGWCGAVVVLERILC